MRRPFDWISSISLMVLVANHLLTDSDTAGPAAVPATPLPAMTFTAVDTVAEGNPFGWIREDGSMISVPAGGPDMPATDRETESRAADPEAAVFTWSSVLTETAPGWPESAAVRASAITTSAWPSSR